MQYRIGDANSGKYMATRIGYIFFYANRGSAFEFSDLMQASAFCQAMDAAMKLMPLSDMKPLKLMVVDENNNPVK
ncbi:hypothetical protein [Furfurilactobacillus rossiae]|uniref:Uncharacterized protein n=1 Tax=Furfurilactobacillus rossiae DSM 15814 TaxID=1114972 RepID=A0A0R1RRY8_9LACO|nr:hypothetical protein [Furfurilactobacillus rossiae]KRL56645.1 hypothetical protein FD35_GL001741 [Furfurilactobacillus rossiae DSM 15814]QFR66454.1 hypothetical protein LR814_04810 [Furfurilactobacillus rossiae]QLE61913.1 hypothetical protein LROSRS0_1868 [Furfurilactobacillus rossiae]